MDAKAEYGLGRKPDYEFAECEYADGLVSLKRIEDVNPKQQHTLKNSINCSGVGLHSGAKVAMCLRPAPANTGIVFHRTDIGAMATSAVSDNAATVSAGWDTVSDTVMSTTVQNTAGVKVGTIEHLMAALAGCAVDNVLIELDGAEVPIMDGSAEPFVQLLENAGMVEQDAPRQVVRVLKRIEVTDGVSSMVI